MGDAQSGWLESLPFSAGCISRRQNVLIGDNAGIRTGAGASGLDVGGECPWLWCAVARVSVIGAGYLGAVHAVVHGRVRSRRRRDRERRGQGRAVVEWRRRPSTSRASRICCGAGCRSGRLTFTSDYGLAADCDVHFVCVGTPQLPGERARTCRSSSTPCAACCRISDRAPWSSVSRLCPWERRSSSGGSWPPKARTATRFGWHGTPSSCARGLPSRTHFTRTASSTASRDLDRVGTSSFSTTCMRFRSPRACRDS